MKRLPQVCPIDGDEMLVPFAEAFEKHVRRAHEDRLGRARAIDVPGRMTTVVRWREFVDLGQARHRAEGVRSVVWLDFPYEAGPLDPTVYAVEWARDGAAVPWLA